jgi:hypothetical protein
MPGMEVFSRMNFGEEEELPQPMRATLVLMEYLEKYLDEIYVREEIDGKWQTCSLSELPVPKLISHVFRFLRENRVPARAIPGHRGTNQNA